MSTFYGFSDPYEFYYQENVGMVCSLLHGKETDM